jgi:hypothetical protein
VNYFLGRTMAMRNKHQAHLVVRLINEDVSVAEKAKIVELWGIFCINTTLMQYKLPRNLTVVALLGTQFGPDTEEKCIPSRRLGYPWHRRARQREDRALPLAVQAARCGLPGGGSRCCGFRPRLWQLPRPTLSAVVLRDLPRKLSWTVRGVAACRWRTW